MITMQGLKGLATGIGSLPYTDADSALHLIFKYCPGIPFWPQLPKRDGREGMVAQFSENFPCLTFTKEGLIFNPKDKDKELEKFYDRIIEEDVEYFRITSDFSAGLYAFYQRLEQSKVEDISKINFIKCHITGPFTFAAGIHDENGVSLLHSEIFMQAIVKGLMMKALWQVSLFKKFGKKIILFIDEPYLGCFGSGFTPVNRDTIIKGLSELTAGFKSENVLIGIHCCGNTDWSLFTDVATIDIINFDAFSFFDRLVLYYNNLKGFFERGGILCWGIVPTQGFNEQQYTAKLLTEKIRYGIKSLLNKGLDKESVVDNLLLSPACGLGTLDIGTTEKIFKALWETAGFIKSGDSLNVK